MTLLPKELYGDRNIAGAIFAIEEKSLITVKAKLAYASLEPPNCDRWVNSYFGA
jgi:hypothetical protein